MVVFFCGKTYKNTLQNVMANRGICLAVADDLGIGVACGAVLGLIPGTEKPGNDTHENHRPS